MEAPLNSIIYHLTGDIRPNIFSSTTYVGEVTIKHFPGGEPHVKVQGDEFATKVYVTSRLRNPQEFMTLLVAIDAIHRFHPTADITAYLPYIPGGRQDRFYSGESLTAKVYARLLNASPIDRIITVDPHSEVQPALLDRVQLVSGLNLANTAYKKITTKYQHSPLVVFPDTGAKKKYVNQLHRRSAIDNGAAVRAEHNLPWYITCDKLRDTQTGKITGFTVIDDYEFDPSEPVLIIDDICDGGGTFLGTAQALKSRGAGDLYLYVTHGIFSKGFEELAKYFKGIYTTDSWSYDYAMEFPLMDKRSEIVIIL